MPAPPPATVALYYDFASSLCYVAHRVLGRMHDELRALGVALRWTPLDLARLAPHHWRRGAPLPEARRRHAAAVARELGVPLVPAVAWLDSRPLHAAALLLEDGPHGATWRERVWTALYEERRPLEGESAVLTLARELGIALDAGAVGAARDRLDALTREARAAEVTGVPTFMLGAWPFGGIQDERTLVAVLRRYVERRAPLAGGSGGSAGSSSSAPPDSRSS